jgi:anti-anti-sigma regulatory factor
MGQSTLDMLTSADGSVIVSPRGIVGPDEAVALRQLLVHAVRRLRPLRLVVDLTGVVTLDPINLGTLAATCGLGDDHDVVVFLDNPSSALAADLAAAGVPRQRLRSTSG